MIFENSEAWSFECSAVVQELELTLEFVRHPRDLQVSVATRFCRVLIFASSQYLSVIYLFHVMIHWWVRKPPRGPNNCMFWAMIKAEGEVGYPWNRFKPPSIFILTVPRRYFCCGSLLLLVLEGARWLSGRVSDSGARGPGFETYRRRVVSLSKTLYSPKVLVNYPGSDGSVPIWLTNCWLGR